MFFFKFCLLYLSQCQEIWKLLWTTNRNMNTIGDLPSEDHTWQNTDNGNWNTETPKSYTPWKNPLLNKNITAWPGVEPVTSWSVGNNIIYKSSGRTLKIHWNYIPVITKSAYEYTSILTCRLQTLIIVKSRRTIFKHEQKIKQEVQKHVRSVCGAY